jgi:hypothetical protein
MGEQFGECMLPKKEKQQQRDPERPDDFRIDPQEMTNLKTETGTRLRKVQTSINAAPQITRVTPVPLPDPKKIASQTPPV